MRRIKTEVAIIGSGSAAVLAANRLMSAGVNLVLINPTNDFGIDDLRASSGLGLWNAAYRSDGVASLPNLYDALLKRLREAFPATVEQTGLRKIEYWSILSSTPLHRRATDELEREYFKLERKSWSSGQIRLVTPENVLARMKQFGVYLPYVSQMEGGVVRAYGLWWDAARMGLYLSHFVQNKFFSETREESARCFNSATIRGRYGRKIVITTREKEELSVECDRGLLIFLTGELLPHLKSIVAACEEPWIQGVRKRRREQHFANFERSRFLKPQAIEDGLKAGDHVDDRVWLELGDICYNWKRNSGTATWNASRGPDGLERVVDEGLRLHSLPEANTRFVRTDRSFHLEWDWKNPQWRKTSHETHWATSFEGDLWNMMEVLWNLPLQ
ncbi:MAG: hypothetical protein AB1540_02125 [Bdellovibrionota bacterium]